MFRPRLRTPPSLAGFFSAPAAARRLHQAPVSRHDPRVGVPGLLSAQGYELAWTKQMNTTLGKLNDLIVGTDYETRELKKIILDTARVPSLASVFNHASMAHNTDFFFKQLVPAGHAGHAGVGEGAARAIPPTLRAAIEDSFGSVETLRREFAATAEGMFGPGFVWLVKSHGLHNTGRIGDTLRLLTTYLAGSPYAGAHHRRQAIDMNTVGAEPVDGAPADALANNPAWQWVDWQRQAVMDPAGMARGVGAGYGPGLGPAPTFVSGDRRPPGGLEVVPLLCLSTWEHVWLRDYGLGAAEDGSVGGKEAFVEAWWDVVDWDAVADLASLNRPSLKTA